MKKSKLLFPLVLMVPCTDDDNLVVIVESMNVTYICGNASLNISWRLNDPSLKDSLDDKSFSKIEKYVTNYIMERFV